MKPRRAKDLATRLHSLIIRNKGACDARNWYGHECAGKLETAHIISRRYAATRTDLDNAFCLCSKAHFRFTEWPYEFTEFITETIGPDKYETLRAKAEQVTKMDWLQELERLETIGTPLGLKVR